MIMLSRVRSGSPLDFYVPDFSVPLPLPVAGSAVAAGFPSPAEDHEEMSLDLNKALIRHPAATFYARVKGSSMMDAGIEDGDLLIIDKALEPKDGDVAVCFIDGEFTVKRIRLEDGDLFLVPANPLFQPVRVTEENEFLVWGIVSYIIHKPR
ncbi:translesion error-prone DNA polymerase V autoproteolytic subunit [Chlorobium phaeovibrioides]|uniref:Translesion error-prone DNA polymerase V autoproteolytic subunit n=1 Tax=Chlorobium phaeovibrioides TaxID=1094 RepID=A0A432ATU6_CHLPH|nr:translesion error-prone DNA polymerase V autoproteolytic subunit [Chlorobium phaeovibrioides]KAA6231803.1 translesion error-prone DNA polymerase V autoproteolytic subunit [Chlorobium phaeovibrioides]MWV54157.1 translesion error-prone DNA polymerase V autoproteolytic subunit [Chlorobium phaeovibrioides]QEQ57638.1 translesion error-prone DNA polymerase V autoproteolytic subunit [Chlorobium phaeovibrioides]RTY34638.1 translesion error-prone DNA polymerase V autoproteolytic subunit [Chlorobium p